MIHIITVYWKSSFWASVQLKHLASNTSGPMKIWALSDEDTKIENLAGIEVDITVIGDGGIRSHAEKLNLLANIVALTCQDDDIIIFLDADAFPIKPYEDFVRTKLSDYPLIAVRRDEEQEPIPHPCFCATTMGFWRQIGGDWRRGPEWVDRDGYKITDVGATLHRSLQSAEIDWLPLLRSNARNLHPQFFGLYEDFLYHHGAGSRKAVSRQEVKHVVHSSWFNALPGVLRARISSASRARIEKKNRQLEEFVRTHVHDAEELCRLFS